MAIWTLWFGNFGWISVMNMEYASPELPIRLGPTFHISVPSGRIEGDRICPAQARPTSDRVWRRARDDNMS